MIRFYNIGTQKSFLKFLANWFLSGQILGTVYYIIIMINRRIDQLNPQCLNYDKSKTIHPPTKRIRQENQTKFGSAFVR